jgi:hypothetical protein
METTPTGIEFCTPRSWEDLSVALNMYQTLAIEPTLDLIIQYIQKTDTAKDFYRYYLLFERYQNDYDVDSILEGKFPTKAKQLKSAKFDERLSLIEVLVNAINAKTMKLNEANQIKKLISPTLKELRKSDESQAKDIFNRALESAKKYKEHFASSAFEKKIYGKIIDLLTQHSTLEELEEKVSSFTSKSKKEAQAILISIDFAFKFIIDTFGEGQELVAFLINLLASYHFVLFLAYYPSATFLKYNESLLIDRKNKQLLLEIKALEDQLDEYQMN